MIGVILAAGKGTRMEPFSSSYPKPILPICNKPLLHYQIEMMKSLGIKKVLIVIGHLGFEIAKSFSDGNHRGIELEFVEQKETLGIAHALGKLEKYIDSPILLVLGDLFLVTENVISMKEKMIKHNAGAVLAVKNEDDPLAIKRNFTVLLDEDGRAKRVIEKPRHVDTKIKGCGLYLFTQQVFDAIRRTPRTAMRDEYEITDTIQILIDDELPVLVSNVVKWDMNVTFPSDVLKCNLYQLDKMNKDKLIGKGCDIHPDAKIENSILGDNVVIETPINIRDSVIFPNTKVASDNDISHFIITPDHHIDCRKYA